MPASPSRRRTAVPPLPAHRPDAQRRLTLIRRRRRRGRAAYVVAAALVNLAAAAPRCPGTPFSSGFVGRHARGSRGRSARRAAPGRGRQVLARDERLRMARRSGGGGGRGRAQRRGRRGGARANCSAGERLRLLVAARRRRPRRHSEMLRRIGVLVARHARRWAARSRRPLRQAASVLAPPGTWRTSRVVLGGKDGSTYTAFSSAVRLRSIIAAAGCVCFPGVERWRRDSSTARRGDCPRLRGPWR